MLTPGVVVMDGAEVADVADVPWADVPTVDLGDSIVSPAPLDLHLHGAGGVPVPPSGTYAELDAALATLKRRHVAEQLARVIGNVSDQAELVHATLSPPYQYIATLPLPGSQLDVVEQVAAAAEGVEESPGCRGLRIEGLFINPQQAGVWPPEGLLPPSIELFEELAEAAQGHLRIVDVAPELPGALELISHARARGIVMSVAHTLATFEETVAAIDAGATLSTHTFNAMTAFHHRAPGAAAAALLDSRVTCELILDATHLHPATPTIAARVSRGQVAFVSDASPFAGCPAGTYEWEGMQLLSTGDRITDAQGRLAGAATLLHGASERAVEGGMDRLQACEAASTAGWRVFDSERPRGIVTGDSVVVL